MSVAKVVSVDVETIPNESKRDLFIKHVVLPQREARGDIADVYRLLYDYLLAQGFIVESESGLDEWVRRQMSTTPEYCQVVGLNWMFPQEEPQSVWVGEEIEGQVVTENMLLTKAWKLFTTPTIVVFNGLAFDIPVVMARSVILGVPALVDLSSLKPWENRVVDLMRKLFANRRWHGLKEVRAHYIPRSSIPAEFLPIDDMAGGEVHELYAAGKYDELKLYGRFDAWTNMAIYDRGKGYWW